MTRYVIGPDVAVHVVRESIEVRAEHQLLAPTLIRSQVLSLLYQSVRRGDLTAKDAEHLLTGVRALRLRLLGDRVLQRVAWTVAENLAWPDTLTAEYVALTRLQADAFVTLDPDLARVVEGIVDVAPVESLS